MHYNNSYNALTAPRYSRVGDNCVYSETEKLELNTPKNSSWERDTMVLYLICLSHQKKQGNIKYSRFIEAHWE